MEVNSKYNSLKLYLFLKELEQMKLNQLNLIIQKKLLKEAWFSFQLKLMQQVTFKKNMKKT